MPKNQTIFECSKCGAQSLRWQGRCTECNAWGTMAEQNTRNKTQETKNNTLPAELTDFNQIKGQDVARVKTNLGEVDRVLGGGIVPGSLVLLGGEPGVGKSTLLLQLASALCVNLRLDQRESASIIYNSGEESAQQIKLRFDRLGLKSDNIKYLGETDIDKVCATIREKKPALAIIDSIQTATSSDVESQFGGQTQIRAATAKLMELAKGENIPIIIIGHITKGGDIAGPKLLEHMVDTVLYFEGEKLSNYRILRAQKNRFGNTNEIGIFEMAGDGLREVKNPSLAFLEQKSNVSGSAITCVLNGARPFLIEVQALTNPTQFGNPMRKASGFDLNRLNIISTIISRRTNINCASQDIILNIAGGIKIQDTAADLAVALAIVSSIKNVALPKNMAAIGELGLGGEIRKVSQLEKRLEEARRLGLSNTLSPKNHKTLGEVLDGI